MRHASDELLLAMNGTAPRAQRSANGIESGCGSSDSHYYNAYAFGWDGGVVDCPIAVTCPRCLALMEEARGPERTFALLVHGDRALDSKEAA